MDKAILLTLIVIITQFITSSQLSAQGHDLTYYLVSEIGIEPGQKALCFEELPRSEISFAIPSYYIIGDKTHYVVDNHSLNSFRF